jgi:uncharacterized protein
MDLHPAMLAHLEAVTQDAARLRDVWAPDGVLEFPYATADMTSRIDGVEALVAYFDGPRRGGDWRFEVADRVEDAPRRVHVAEVHATATWLESGRPYVQDYVIWMTLGEDGRIRSWREYWDKSRV